MIGDRPMLTHSQARQIAESNWGRGGTNSEPTNRPGAFYFSCSGHGGFVIDVAALTEKELAAIEPYILIETADLYTWGRHTLFMHPYRKRGGKTSMRADLKQIRFFMLEEDCAWCLAYVFTDIRHRNKPQSAEYAQRLFDEYHRKAS